MQPTRSNPAITDHFLVTDRVAIVTGAGRGIGAATARTLAEAGADVVISSRTRADLDDVADAIHAAGRRAVVIESDLDDVTTLPPLVDAAITEFGRLDIVVNNVGGYFPRPLLDTTVGALERAFHFNVSTAFALTKAAAARLVESPGGGTVVNISSLIGRISDRGFAAYGTAKAALTHLTRLTAADLAPRARVNGIAVGSTATSALEVVLADETYRNQMEAATPLRRLGEPLDIALGVLYLCSPAGSYLTGKILEIDGGLESPNLPLGLPDL